MTGRGLLVEPDHDRRCGTNTYHNVVVLSVVPVSAALTSTT